jgi:hypothetical protein
MSDMSNQTTSSVFSPVEYFLVETSAGNSLVIAQAPAIKVGFYTFTPGKDREYEVSRHKLDVAPGELQNLISMSKTHKLTFDKATKKVIATPKGTVQPTN